MVNEDRVNVIQKLGGKCVKCGITDTAILHIDHKLGQGYLEKQYFENPKKMYEYYAKNFEDEGKYLQVLCLNCNYSKRIANKETKDRPNLWEDEIWKMPPFKPGDEEYEKQFLKKLGDYLDRYPQFLPISHRKFREIKKIADKSFQEMERNNKFKEPGEWEKEGY